MTVIADVGGGRVPNIHRLCPDIDIVGINSYGGAPSIPQRYRDAVPEGYEPKPYVLTEYGPAGSWEVPMNDFDVPEEQTSTQKANVYRETYLALEQDTELCLGSFAFTWGAKREATSTWFGLFLHGEKPGETAEKLAGVDTLAELWGGDVGNLCPTIEPLEATANTGVAGDTITVTTAVADPEGDDLETTWTLSAEQSTYFTGGDTQPELPTFDDAISAADNTRVTITLPETPGVYRFHAVVRDGNGSAATASLPLLVKAKPGAEERAANDAVRAALPLAIVGDDVPGAYVPSGWMGAVAALTMDERDTTDPHTGATALKFAYTAADGWAGVVWQSPANDWGNVAGGFDLTGATKLTFWARGADGGETIGFGIGGIEPDKPFFDTATADLEVTLTDQWKRYEIPLAGKDLSRIKSGFRWSAAANGKPFAFYLDDVRYE
ncbi:MAG: hypothetical protein AAF743_08020, partial [Planctomycetota bacterium]